MWFALLLLSGVAPAAEPAPVGAGAAEAPDPSAEARACPAPATEADLAGALDAAERSFLDLDPTGFAQARATAMALLPCLRSPLGATLAARFHRTEALGAYGEGQIGLAAGHLAAASVADPTFAFPPDVLPAGHPVLELYAEAPSRLGASETVAPPLSGVIRLDGRDAAPRYPSAPTVAQWLDNDRVRFTALVPAGAALPDYPRKPDRSIPRWGRALRWTGLGMIGVGGATTAIALPIAASRRSAFLDATPEDMTRADLLALQRGTNRAATTAIVGGVTAALGAGAVGASFAW